jgi:hypothetical protein
MKRKVGLNLAIMPVRRGGQEAKETDLPLKTASSDQWFPILAVTGWMLHTPPARHAEGQRLLKISHTQPPHHFGTRKCVPFFCPDEMNKYLFVPVENEMGWLVLDVKSNFC